MKPAKEDALSDASAIWGQADTAYFYQLTPDRILDAIEQAMGRRCTGRSFAHNSLENRVYELELETEDGAAPSGRSRYENYVIAKFYRPGRWSAEQIREEHHFLHALKQEEIPVVAPLILGNQQTLGTVQGTDILFAVFPKVGGRSPEELRDEQIDQVGRLLARMHNVGACQKVEHRLKLGVDTFALDALSFLTERELIPSHLRESYRSLVLSICDRLAPALAAVETIQIHGDCHLGNLLWGPQGPFWVDFDDSMIGPPIQDLWLLLPGRDQYAKNVLRRLLAAYQSMREFDWSSLQLIEGLRALRLIHFSNWIARRSEDPIFKKYFSDFGDERYWQVQIQDLREQLSFMSENHWQL